MHTYVSIHTHIYVKLYLHIYTVKGSLQEEEAALAMGGVDGAGGWTWRSPAAARPKTEPGTSLP